MTAENHSRLAWLVAKTGGAIFSLGVVLFLPGYLLGLDRLEMVGMLVMMSGLAIFAPAEAVRVWRDDSPNARKLSMPWALPFPPGLWRGAIRSMPTWLTTGAVPCASGVVALTIDAINPAWFFETTMGRVLRPTLIGLLGAGLVGAGALTATITLFNRPRGLIPPHLRGQPSALQERRDGTFYQAKWTRT